MTVTTLERQVAEARSSASIGEGRSSASIGEEWLASVAEMKSAASACDQL